jgi:hypothetical protein
MPSQSDAVLHIAIILLRVVIDMKLTKWAMTLSMFVSIQALSQTTPGVRPYLKEATISQTSGTVHIEANSPRPLAQVLDALRQKYGWVVDYEDPQYVSSVDVLPAPDNDPQSQLPGGGSFSVDFPAAAPDPEKTLRLVVDSYNRSKNPGRFDLRGNGQSGFFVVGTSARDEKGGISPQQVLFDIPVTLPVAERTITDTVNLICQQMSAQSHIAVTLGVSPRSLLDRTTVKVGGTKVPARELLLQSLMATHHSLYWRFLFDPGSKGYFLSIHSSQP